ncbi:HNH endonuclease [Streptomyces sp. NPDC093261]|uniref:HNH endonuclease n=1 Tax=Streptomyces sp. NPDC093261 TaxID=3366037 RepID=UPI003816D878
MASGVRYGSGDNAVLCWVLFNLWKQRCYWCGRPADFNIIQIDHILPKDAGAKRLEELKIVYGLPADFDINDPQNLAPCCSGCNGPRGKGNDEYGPVPRLLTLLKRARRLRPMVIKQVQNFGNSMTVAGHLLAVGRADLKDKNIRQAFEQYAPAVAQKLALLDVSGIDVASFRTVEVMLGGGADFLDVGVSLNARGRTAVSVLKDLCGCELDGILQERIPELLHMIREDVRARFEAGYGPSGPVTAAWPTSVFTRVDVDSIDYANTGESVEFTLKGNFEESLSTSLVQSSPDGSALDDLQGDAVVLGTFSFVVSWHFSEPEEVDTGECCIDSQEVDIHPVAYARRRPV